MADICVAHLVRAQNGPAPFRDFIESYRAHPAGVEHDLLIIFKGFEENSDLSAYKTLLEGIPYQALFLPDKGFDILPYFRVAEVVEHPFLCFFNSFSVLLDDGWLAKMYRHVKREGVGVVGATGSWASHYSGVQYDHGKPSAYADIMSDLKHRFGPTGPRRPVMFELSEELEEKIQKIPALRRLGLRLYYYGAVASYYRVVKSISFALKQMAFYIERRKRRRTFNALDYDPFPTVHLRTNAFMIRREVMLKSKLGEIVRKVDAHRFESGKQSMTNQVLRMDLKVLVVGRDGRGYEKEEWPLSETLFQGEQRNLLVADNQTRDYQYAKLLRRTVLSRGAWGNQASPSGHPGLLSNEVDYQTTDICVLHLVWKPLGLKPLRDFIASYKRNPGGLQHRLVVAFNGFDGEHELGAYREVLEGVQHEWFLVSPPTQDIPVYFEAAKRFSDSYFCFLNSHSVILDEQWLAKMYAHVSREGVGLIGATGSWASHYSEARWGWGMRSAYDGILADLRDEYDRRYRPVNNSVVFQLSEGLEEKIRTMPPSGRVAYSLYYYGVVRSYYRAINWARSYPEQRKEKLKRLQRFSSAGYYAYPAPHLRTNAFMLSREVMLKLTSWEMNTKDDAYKFEGGKRSMTNQVLRMGLKVLVVGRDGRGYEPDEWPLSETLWQGEQHNLLVADNNTRDYAHSDVFRRTFLSRFAWGWEATVKSADKVNR